jgi:predicted dehydrogenase
MAGVLREIDSMIEYSKPIRWAIIGCGDVTERKSGPAYQQTEGFELVAVMRRDLLKAEDYARRHGVAKATDQAEVLLNDPEIDAIYIATPPDSHMDYALKVAAADKICCIEKPMVSRFADGPRIVEAFAAKSLPLFVAYYRRTLPRFLKVKSLLQENCLGDLRHVQWTYCGSPQPVKGYDWRTDKVIAPGGYFDDLASHGLDLLVYLLGDIAEAKGVCCNQQGLYTAPDSVSACWMHQSGVTGTGAWNFGSAEYLDCLEIQGSKGSITFSVFANEPVILKRSTQEERFNIAHPDPVQKYHVQAMADQLFEGKPHPSTGATGLHTSWVMDQILFGE